jgi:hypothetical protein
VLPETASNREEALDPGKDSSKNTKQIVRKARFSFNLESKCYTREG